MNFNLFFTISSSSTLYLPHRAASVSEASLIIKCVTLVKKSLEAAFRATLRCVVTSRLDTYSMLAQHNLAITALSCHFLQLSAGSWSQIAPESELCMMKLPTGFTQQSRGSSNRVALPNAQTANLKLAAAASSMQQLHSLALMIHMSWIKHRQQGHQQVSWTMSIRKTLYLRKLQHIACSRAVGSSSVCWVVRVGCWQPNWGPTVWIERWFFAIIEIGL